MKSEILLVVCLLVAGCRGGSSGSGSAAPAASVAPATVVAPELEVDPTEPLEVDAATKAVLRECVKRHYASFEAEVQRRIEQGGELDEEAITQLLEERQAALDAEIEAKLTPEQRAAFQASLEK